MINIYIGEHDFRRKWDRQRVPPEPLGSRHYAVQYGKTVHGRLNCVPHVRLPLELRTPEGSRSTCFTMVSCAQRRQRPVFIAICMYSTVLGWAPGAKNSHGGPEMTLHALCSRCRRPPVSFGRVCQARLIAIDMRLTPLGVCYVRRLGAIAWATEGYAMFVPLRRCASNGRVCYVRRCGAISQVIVGYAMFVVLEPLRGQR